MLPKDDTAVNDQAVAQETAPTVPAAVETNDPITAENALDDDAFDDIDDGLDEAEEGAEGDDSQDELAAVETPPKEQPQGEGKELSPKNEWEKLNGKAQDRFRQTVNERNDLRRQLAEVEARKAQVAQEQSLVNEVNPQTGDYYTPQEAERSAFVQSRQDQRDRLEQEEYTLQVQQNQTLISDESRKVIEEFPEFRQFNADGTPNLKFDQETTSAYEKELADNLIYQLPNGEQHTASALEANGIDPFKQATLVGSSVSPYKLAKLIADSSARAAAREQTIGRAQAQRSTEKMLANVDVPGGNSHAGKDSDLDDFDKAYDDD